MFSFLNFKEKSAVSQIFALAHLTGSARKGSAPLRCGCCLLKHKNPGPSELFPCSAPPCLAVTGGQRGRDWRSLTNRKGKRPCTTNTPDFIVYGVTQQAGKKDILTRVGGAWKHTKGDGINVQIRALPLNFDGKIVLFPPKDDEAGAAQGAVEETPF